MRERRYVPANFQLLRHRAQNLRALWALGRALSYRSLAELDLKEIALVFSICFFLHRKLFFRQLEKPKLRLALFFSQARLRSLFQHTKISCPAPTGALPCQMEAAI